MKKIYQNPDVKIVKVQPMQMIAESLNVNGDYNSSTITMGSRRKGGVWDDDEDYDEDYDY